MKKLKFILASLTLALLLPATALAQVSRPTANPGNDGIGMEGRIAQPPPTDAPTISLPVDGTHYTDLPVTVTGLCTDDLLVRIFKNNVMGGAVMCEDGSYTIQMDLFPGENELSAIQYDDLDQASPVSNKITLFYDIPVPTIPGSPDEVQQRITLTSNFARLGADPGTELTWPINLSGGTGPYAISVDWGDGTGEQLQSLDSAGTFNIKHTYARSGVYKVVIKATDRNGNSAFLQLVGIANGKISTAAENDSGDGTTVTKIKVLWWPAAICIPLIITTFWLGKRYQLKRIRYRMKHRIMPIDK